MIEIRDLSYWYKHTTEPALADINVEFPRGTISAILGESGSGKTTLLMCLGRFLRPTDGQILLDDTDIQEMPALDFRRALGIVFQKLYLFPHLSVMENMTLAPIRVLKTNKAEARSAAMKTLDRLGITDLAESYPSQISGGQAQRVAIARGLLLRPDYMLLDEPTSALDANTTDEFARWLGDLGDQTNFIIVTHDLPFARKVASTGVYLSGGRILDQGPVEDIIQHVRAGKLVESTET